MPKSVKALGNYKFRLTVSCGYDESGKQKTRSKTVECKRGETEAYQMLGKFKIELQNQTIVSKKKEQTLSSFIREKWLPNYAMLASNSPATYDSYFQITKRIIEALGHLHIAKIKRDHVGKFIYALRNSKAKHTNNLLSPTTVRRHQDVLKMILAKAVEWGDISTNPAENLPRVKVPKKEKSIPNDGEMSTLLEVFEKEPLRRKAMFYILINAGIRRSEFVALKWKDVDLVRKNISITAVLVKNNKKGLLRKVPKTEYGQRKITISDECCELLIKLKQEKAKLKPLLMKQSNYNVDIFDYVFWNTDTCAPYHPDSITHLIPDLCKKAGVKTYSPHAFRHWLCSGLLDDRIPVKHVQKLMGHSDASTTLNVYTHIMKSSTINTADAVSSKLSMLKGNE